MAVTKYSDKGSALTWGEMEANWDELINLLSKISVAGSKVFVNGAVDDGVNTLLVNGGIKSVLGNTSGALTGNVLRLTRTVSYPGDFSIVAGGDSTPSLWFYDNTNAATRMIIDTSGNLLVGAGSGSRHTFNKSVSGAVLQVENKRNLAGDYGVLTLLGANCNDTNSYHYIGSTAGNDRIYIFGNGNIQNSNNSYGALSDVKLKRDIETARSYLDNLCEVRIVKYGLVSEPETDARYLGVVAQELEQIFPGLIDQTRDTAERQARNESGELRFEQKESGLFGPDGQPIMVDDPERPIIERYETGEVTKGVKYSVFVPMLVTAVQELKAKNDALEARIAALEAAMTQL